MMIGIISDTHDNMYAVKKCADMMRDKGVEYILHAGDYAAPFVYQPLKDVSAKFFGVFGNNDCEKSMLIKRFGEFGKILGYFGEIDIDRKKFVLYHGTYANMTEALSTCEKYDFFITGHTHKPYIKKSRNTLIINPGECCGYLTGKRTFAILDLEKDYAEIIEF